jgi:hypothetical protein
MQVALLGLAFFAVLAAATPVPAYIDLPIRHAGPMRIDSRGRAQNGAVNKILLSEGRVAYAASVAGGIWRTENIKDASPRWRPLTDDLVCEQCLLHNH